jgi:hypothetical protein
MLMRVTWHDSLWAPEKHARVRSLACAPSFFLDGCFISGSDGDHEGKLVVSSPVDAGRGACSVTTPHAPLESWVLARS